MDYINNKRFQHTCREMPAIPAKRVLFSRAGRHVYRRRRRIRSRIIILILAVLVLLYGMLFMRTKTAADVQQIPVSFAPAEPNDIGLTYLNADSAQEPQISVDIPLIIQDPVLEVPEAPEMPEVLPEPWYTEWELEITAIIIYQEAGVDACSDDTRYKVGEVFWNRVNNPDFPNTAEEVATAEAQYGTLHWTGIQWPDRAKTPAEAHAVERAWTIARQVLEGDRTMPEDTVWQAEFPQGSEIVAYQDSMYFCR